MSTGNPKEKKPYVMRAVSAFALVLLAGAGFPPLMAETPPTSASVDEILVTGERPGPGMWRVSQGHHQLWILATLEPLPKKMVWRSQVVETRITSSQAVIAPPRVSAEIGFFRGLTLIPSLLSARNSPDGRTLEQTLPHELYIRWLALRVKYLSGDGDEHRRPMVAAVDIYWRALDQSGLTLDENVWKVVEQTAKKSRVTILPVTVKFSVDEPKDAVRELKQIPRAAEIACMTKVIERLETDLQPMRQRANMWSLGDIEGLRTLPAPNEQLACLDAVFSIPKLRDRLKQTMAQIEDEWLRVAQIALDKNDSSFAVVPLFNLWGENGWLAKLRERGYQVQDP